MLSCGNLRDGATAILAAFHAQKQHDVVEFIKIEEFDDTDPIN